MNAHVVPRKPDECLSRRVGGCCTGHPPRARDAVGAPTKAATAPVPSLGPRRRGKAAFAQTLATFGLVEVETLNHVAPSGSCQFSSVGEQLFGRMCDHAFRYDRLLRAAACAEIERRSHDFQPYLIAARVRTRRWACHMLAAPHSICDATRRGWLTFLFRCCWLLWLLLLLLLLGLRLQLQLLAGAGRYYRQERRGGDSIDMGVYLQHMRSETCDGDHVTLQALSDVTGAVINVVHWDAGRGTAVVLPPVSPHAEAICHVDGPLKAAAGQHIWLSLRGESHFRSLRAAASTPSPSVSPAACM